MLRKQLRFRKNFLRALPGLHKLLGCDSTIAFHRRVQEEKGGRIVRLSPRALGCHKKYKTLSFCEIRDNPTPPLLLIRPPDK